MNLLVSYWTIGSKNATVRVNLGLRMRMETVSERQRDVTETQSVVDKEKKVWSRIWKKVEYPLCISN
jgi:hypothetical protein